MRNRVDDNQEYKSKNNEPSSMSNCNEKKEPMYSISMDEKK
jgi:hypothetical protein